MSGNVGGVRQFSKSITNNRVIRSNMPKCYACSLGECCVPKQACQDPENCDCSCPDLQGEL